MVEQWKATGAALVVEDDVRRYDTPIFIDADLQAEVRDNGYAVRPPILGPAELAAFEQLAAEFLEAIGGRWGDQFFTVGRIEDTALRARMVARAGDIVLPRLAPHYVAGTRLMASAFQVKPPSPTSELNPHQDSSLVDETRWPGVYGWMALDDTDERNGGLQVVPGSHRIVNPQRTLSVPWQLTGLEEVMRRHCVPLTVPAGGIVFFDSALIHCSPPNRSHRVRMAASSFARPAEAGLLHLHQDERTSHGMVEVYEIEPSFLYGDDIMSRPGPPHRFLGERAQHLIDCTAEEFDEVLTAAAAGTGLAAT